MKDGKIFTKKFLKKGISLIISCSMFVSGLSFGTLSQKSTETKAESAKQMKMPIVVLDHLNDNLLFQYLNVDKIFGLTMFKENPGDPDSENLGKGLVEDELGPNGTPVYKKEVVEHVAETVQYTLEWIRSQVGYEDRQDITQLYRKISDQILSAQPTTTVVEENNSNDVTKSLEEMGWSFGKADISLTESPDNAHDTYYDAGGNKLWWREGDQLFTDNYNTDNTASFDYGELEAGTYRVYAVWANNVDAKITTPDGESEVVFVQENDENQTGTGRGGVIYDFTTTQKGNVKITFTPDGNARGNIADFRLVKIQDEVKTQILENQIDRHGTVSAEKLGWTTEEGSSWSAFNGGGITCEKDDTTKAYKEVNVTAGEKYKFRAEMNDNNLCKIWLEDENGNALMDSIPNTDNENALVTIPAGVQKVRIYVQNSDATKDGTRRVGQIFMTSQAEARLGSYNESKAKYDSGAKLKDVETCMDYAYYMLNNFWTDTNGDITQKTNLYKTLTLDLMENSDKYHFSTNQKINYDIENKNISQDLSVSDNQGLFPLDNAILGDKSDLTAPFGVADGEFNNHNFHYGLKAHCQFLYDSSKNLEFIFNGDDDVYLFINGKLAMDIGGAHAPMGGEAILSYHAADPNAADQVEKERVAKETAEKLGLVDGEVYDFDFFYLERHTDLSNMLIETNMPLLQAGVTPKVTYKVDGEEIADGSSVEAGKKVDVEYSVTSNTKIAHSAPNKLTGLEMKDDSLGVFIGREGNQPKIELGDAEVDTAITVTVKDASGAVKETISISKEDLESQDKIAEFVKNLSEIQLDNKESVTISGISIPMQIDKKLKSELNVNVVAPEAFYNDEGNIEYKNSEVSTVPVSVAAIPVNEPEIAIEGKLVDDAGNAYNSEQKLAEGTSVNATFTVTSKAVDMSNIGIDDTNGTGFVMSKAGIVIPNGFDINNGLVVTYTKADGTTEEIRLSKTDIDNKTNVYNTLLNKLGNNALDAWKLDANETITVSGLHKNMNDAEIKINPKGLATGPVPTYNKETDTVTITDESVTATDAEKKVIPLGKVHVTFDATEKGRVTEGNASQTPQVGYGVTTPTISENEGYEFKGWKMEGDATEQLYQAEDINKMTFAEDTTFVAQYDTIQVNVRFEQGTNGTLSGKTDQMIYYNTGVEAVPTTIAAQGYGFIGWKKQGDDTDKIYSTDEIKDLKFTEDTTFIAQYELGKVTVTFDPNNNGTITQGDVSQKINYGESVTTPTISENEGYIFKGWSIDGGDTAELYQAEDIDQMNFTEDTTFIAQYDVEKYTYTVKYVDEESNTVAESKTVNDVVAGTSVTEYPVPVEGYEADVDSITEIINSDGKELIFTYKKKMLDVTYKADNHGKLDGDNGESVEYGNKPVKVPTPTAEEGYKFAGWTMTTTEGNASVDDPASEMITENTVFTAIFEPINSNYTVKYVDESGKEIFQTKVGYAPIGENVTENAEDISGYKVVGDKTVTILISDNDDENIIVFKYTKSQEPTTEAPTTAPPVTVQPTTVAPTKENQTSIAPTKEEPTSKKREKVTTDRQEETATKNTAVTPRKDVTNTSTVSPKTGGASNVLAWLMAALFASLGLLGYAYAGMKRERKTRR